MESASTNTSRDASPEAAAADEFFKSVSQTGFPEAKPAQHQPWRTHWKGPEAPSRDGRLLVASPKICTYGSNNLGGL